ncbi:helix-turn-helix domain-containing protein [Bradyrhizobium jicamae]|uniref:helix-turn-helix domain-containing protein n=1 Tax=Bradyrhizobium jicamae TaxID=280332 RepID=UPI001BA5425F|nr:helix-turn-helix transcriptional regulator [Bradyrhizobium jicamae]MBR0939508.1 helix-turn-helix transcriptional regulator [Bradyrhizobium jicamae]
MAKAKSKHDPEFSGRLKLLREQRSMNVAEFAKLIKVSPAAIWHWENKGTVPRSGTVGVIADVLGVSRSYLQTGKQSNGEVQNGDTRDVEVRGSGRSVGIELSLEELVRAIEAKGFEVSIRTRS